jgi:hypothetical protein
MVSQQTADEGTPPSYFIDVSKIFLYVILQSFRAIKQMLPKRQVSYKLCHD